MGLTNSPLCGRCEANYETSAHMLCECEVLASFKRIHLGSSFLDPEDIKSLSVGAIWNFSKGTGLPWIGNSTKDPFLRPMCIGTVRARTQLLINQSIATETLHH